jgi:hypothetical protein
MFKELRSVKIFMLSFTVPWCPGVHFYILSTTRNHLAIGYTNKYSTTHNHLFVGFTIRYYVCTYSRPSDLQRVRRTQPVLRWKGHFPLTPPPQNRTQWFFCGADQATVYRQGCRYGQTPNYWSLNYWFKKRATISLWPAEIGQSVNI